MEGNMTLKEKLKHKYALSEQGAIDMIKAFISVTISDIVLMIPIGLLYGFVRISIHILTNKSI